MAHKVSSLKEEASCASTLMSHQQRQLISLVCASQYEDGFYGGMENPYSMGHAAHLNHGGAPPPPMHNSYHGANNHVMSNNVMGAIPDVHKRDKDAIYRYATLQQKHRSFRRPCRHPNSDTALCLYHLFLGSTAWVIVAPMFTASSLSCVH